MQLNVIYLFFLIKNSKIEEKSDQSLKRNDLKKTKPLEGFEDFL